MSTPRSGQTKSTGFPKTSLFRFWIFSVSATLILFVSLLFVGAVDIPSDEVLNILLGKDSIKSHWSIIVLQTRLPMAITAFSSGITLSVAGLMMQTSFSNPLAGPSVLGVSSGASLGVAVLMLGTQFLPSLGELSLSLVSFAGAILGGMAVILILLAFSSLIRNNVVLLVAGIMISYLCSSLISLLNYFSPAEGIRSYLFWGLGSYTGLQLNSSCCFLCVSIVCCTLSLLTIKPLNALLAGDRYMESVGYSVKRVRSLILLLAGLLVAVPTAYCGPVGFIGLVVPHLARIFLRSSNHLVILPATVILGGMLSLLCCMLGVLPASVHGVLPINVITPFIGIPVIFYLLIRQKRILYMQ